ncbi:MAG: hypothetical protein QXL27_09860 [Candidatus Bathyarchaeia archaeon]
MTLFLVIWSSPLFLATTEEYVDKSLKLVEGSPHEIKRVIKVEDWKP